jgi:hypothetical protein
VLVEFAQEVPNTSPTGFAVLNTGGAIGGIAGSWSASSISKSIGAEPSLWATSFGGGVVGT